MVDDGRTDDGRTTDGRTTEHGYTISSPCEPDGSGELKMYRIYRKILDSFQGDFEFLLQKWYILEEFLPIFTNFRAHFLESP